MCAERMPSENVTQKVLNGNGRCPSSAKKEDRWMMSKRRWSWEDVTGDWAQRTGRTETNGISSTSRQKNI